MGLAPLSHAALVCTGTANSANVLSINGAGNVCYDGGAPGTIFSTFGVSWTSGSFPGTATVGIISSSVTGSEVLLNFQVAAPGPTGDLLLTYTATNINGIDFNGHPSGDPGSNLILGEIACDTAFVNQSCPAGHELANLFGTWNNGDPSLIKSATFASTSVVYIQKDLTYNNISLSQFTNSQAIPEPMTFSLLGLGLLGLGFAGRRRMNKK